MGRNKAKNNEVEVDIWKVIQKLLNSGLNGKSTLTEE